MGWPRGGERGQDGSEGGTYTTVWIAVAVQVVPLLCVMRWTSFTRSAGDNRAKVAKSKWRVDILENCMRANWPGGKGRTCDGAGSGHPWVPGTRP